MASKQLTEQELLAFGFQRCVDAADKKKITWVHPSFGSYSTLPTHLQLLNNVFDLGWYRRISYDKVHSDEQPAG